MATKKSEVSEIAVLQTQMETAIKTLDRLESKLDAQNANFAPKDEVEILKKEVSALKEDNDKVKGAINLLKGSVALLTAVGVIVGALWWTR